MFGTSRQNEILDKIELARQLLNKLTEKVTTMIINRVKEEGENSQRELQQRCVRLAKPQKQKSFLCRFCDKTFADGRQLGGHVSRAHRLLLEDVELEGDSHTARQPIKEKPKKKTVKTTSKRPRQKQLEEDDIYLGQDA